MRDDDLPWADPVIRTTYEAALGRFILTFNEVDYRLSTLIRRELDARGRADLAASVCRGSYAQRVDTVELLLAHSPSTWAQFGWSLLPVVAK